MEEERKESLTKATIQANLKQNLKFTIIRFFLLLSFSVFGCLLVKWIWDSAFFPGWAAFILSLGFLSLPLLMVTNLVEEIKRSVDANKMNFSIVTDQLIGREDPHGSFKSFLTSYRDPYVLRFAFHGKYAIPYVPCYRFSKFYDHMCGVELFDSCQIGDTFLLIVRGKTILSVYNTRLFELADEKEN